MTSVSVDDSRGNPVMVDVIPKDISHHQYGHVVSWFRLNATSGEVSLVDRRATDVGQRRVRSLGKF